MQQAVPSFAKDWKKQPGEEGFNNYAAQIMKDVHVIPDSKDKVKCTGEGEFYLQPYQRTVQFLFSPKTPVNRLLVMHRTGSGKTISMLNILNNF